MQNRLVLQYAVEGDLRFLSHQDSLRLFERALARAGVCVRYSQGFNPRPRMRIALPRPVGVASSDELLVVELTTRGAPSDILARLSGQAPTGMTFLAAEEPVAGDRWLPCEVRYGLDVEPAMSEDIARRSAEFMSKDRVEVARIHFRTRSTKRVNIRAYVLTMGVDGHRLRWTQSVAAIGTARIGEVLEALELPGRRCLARVQREGVSCRP